MSYNIILFNFNIYVLLVLLRHCHIWFTFLISFVMIYLNNFLPPKLLTKLYSEVCCSFYVFCQKYLLKIYLQKPWPKTENFVFP